jgi:hypothetical protein
VPVRASEGKIRPRPGAAGTGRCKQKPGSSRGFYKVTLTADERQQLETLVSSGKAAARKLTHARVLLLADEGDHGPGRTKAVIVTVLGWGSGPWSASVSASSPRASRPPCNRAPSHRAPTRSRSRGRWRSMLVELACSERRCGRETGANVVAVRA